MALESRTPDPGSLADELHDSKGLVGGFLGHLGIRFSNQVRVLQDPRYPPSDTCQTRTLPETSARLSQTACPPLHQQNANVVR